MHELAQKTSSHMDKERFKQRMRKVIRPGSLRNRLFWILFSLVFLAVLLVGLISYYAYYSVAINEIGRSRVDVITQIGERVSVIKNSLKTVSSLFYHDDAVIELVNAKSEEIKNNEQILNLYVNASRYKTTFESINVTFNCVIIAENGFKFSLNYAPTAYDYDKLLNSPWIGKIIDKRGGLFWVSNFNEMANDGSRSNVFSVARTMLGTYSRLKVALLFITVNERSLFETYRNTLNGDNTIYIMDEDGNVVSHSDPKMIGTNLGNLEQNGSLFGKEPFSIIKKDNASYLISRYYDAETQWSIIEEVPLAKLLGPLNRLRDTIIVIIAIIVCISSLIALMLSRRTSKPINHLCDAMDSFANGNLSVVSNVQGWQEINSLNNRFNQMIRMINDLIQDVKKQEEDKRKAELDFLLAQINPHLLYNTLFSIKCLVAMDRNEQAVEMIQAFTSLLKSILNNRNAMIDVQSEIESVRQYAIIQKFRYRDKFEIVFDVPEDLARCKIPKMILQPIIENSIFHGIEPKLINGLIEVTVKRADRDLIMIVSDDGVGIDSKYIDSIIAGRNSGPDTANKISNGIGIHNVQQRIQMYFGEKYGIQISSELNRGTSVTITLPIIL